jgi:hypothetical protein
MTRNIKHAIIRAMRVTSPVSFFIGPRRLDTTADFSQSITYYVLLVSNGIEGYASASFTLSSARRSASLFPIRQPGQQQDQIIHAPHPCKGFFRVLVQEWARSNANG